MYRVHGFTLAELMMAIAIGAILVTVGIPSYLDVIERNTISTTSNDLLGALLYARSEAVRQEVTTTFTPEADGWMVTVGNVTLADHTVDSDNITINGDPVNYSPRGRASLANTRSIDISYKGTLESRVCLAITGRPFIKLVEHGNCP
ncbi:MAG: GspH/FimT family pseudopilin [Candidatus Thiodiazotropha sp. (ex Ctena orbiculata)]|uniref:Type II secretion system protein H n=1 Tax=Candidatus Thiodiazotropha taylori TaxID=2792791 RepID=A0A944QTV6_9GAMM|nr:GspH/FimT family pseudopilin [Candidatus Thiodiazotropha taylori]MBV2136454.1 GspH/FimT family pseudopilin [Candidatus Thiodiazotropha taylori]